MMRCALCCRLIAVTALMSNEQRSTYFALLDLFFSASSFMPCCTHSRDFAACCSIFSLSWSSSFLKFARTRQLILHSTG